MLGAALAHAGEPRDLNALARSILGRGQGVDVETADGTVLLAQAADIAVHPASVSKIPTSLALLRRFGAEYRFVTTFAASGPVHDGVLAGDLTVQSEGDPSFVDENALLVVERLRALGIQRISGGLRIQGDFTFDWKPDTDGERLRLAMSGTVPAAAWDAVRALPSIASDDATPPRIDMAGAADADAAPLQPLHTLQPLVIHRSQPSRWPMRPVVQARCRHWPAAWCRRRGAKRSCWAMAPAPIRPIGSVRAPRSACCAHWHASWRRAATGWWTSCRSRAWTRARCMSA
jgi:hypothetical protein